MYRPGIWIGKFRKHLRTSIHSEDEGFVVQAFNTLQDFGTYSLFSDDTFQGTQRLTVPSTLANFDSFFKQVR